MWAKRTLRKCDLKMTALQILEKLNSRNITLTVDEGLLRYKAPKGTMTDETIKLLRDHKTRLIEILIARQTTPSITVQKMDVCLHCSGCEFISLVDDRQVCRKNNQPIFDMTVCPVEKWWKSGQDSKGLRKKINKTTGTS